MVNNPLLRRFPVPEGIPSAVTLPELALLQRYAFEAGTVLEIGTLYGFTCIGMALAGAHVTSVDPHNEGPEGASTWGQFTRNLARHGIGLCCHPVMPLRTRSQDIMWMWQYMPQEFGMVFIDGDHIAPAPWRDSEIAMAHLAPGGWIAFHDVTPRWPDVWQAALQLNAKGWREVGREGTLRVYQKP